MRGERLTTSSDVYSLGVLLYLLLSGHLPYRFREQRAAAFETVICGVDPLPPSKAVAFPDARQRVATPARRSCDVAESAGRLAKDLAGDLDTIALTALHKEPERRYASVEALAEDVRRHLDFAPIRARADSWLYRAGRFTRRHRLGVGAALAVSLTVIVAAGLIWHQRQEARRHQARAESVVELVAEDIFGAAVPARSRGATLTAREVLDLGAERVERRLADDLELRARWGTT